MRSNKLWLWKVSSFHYPYCFPFTVIYWRLDSFVHILHESVFFMFLLIPAKGGLPCACPMFGTAVSQYIWSNDIESDSFSWNFNIFMFVCTFHLQHLTAYSTLWDKEQLAYVNNEVVYGLKTKDWSPIYPYNITAVSHINSF